MKKLFDAIEKFFEPVVPAPLKRPYKMGFHYGVFVFGGFFGYVLYFVVQENLYNAGVPRAISLAVGLVLAILLTFTYHRYVTFEERGGWREKFLKFAPSQFAIAGISYVLALYAIERLHFPSLPATFVITLVLSLVNFAANKLFIFKKQVA